jgi:hypothetical protein
MDYMDNTMEQWTTMDYMDNTMEIWIKQWRNG